MILLVTALQCEAKPFIDALSLKRLGEVHSHRLYQNNNITLVVSGVGKVHGAIATTLALAWLKQGGQEQTLRQAVQNLQAADVGVPTVVCNVGICGSAELIAPTEALCSEALESSISADSPSAISTTLRKGCVVLAHKITDVGQDRSYFPDIVVRHPFAERSLSTFDRPVDGTFAQHIDNSVVDMEGAGVCEAALRFLPSSAIQCIKIPFDALDPARPTPSEVSDIIAPQVAPIMQYLEQHAELVGQAESDRKEALEGEYRDLFLAASSYLSLTVAQQHLLRKVIEIFSMQKRSIASIDITNTVSPTSKHQRSAAFAELIATLKGALVN